VRFVLGGGETEVPCDGDPAVLDFRGAMSKDDKILVNYLEHVSCAIMCYSTNSFTKLTHVLHLGAFLDEGSDSGEVCRSSGAITHCGAGGNQCPAASGA
jgi:hypothetical protein